MKKFLLLILLLCPAFWSGCSGKKVDDTDPSVLMKDAEDDIKNDQYLNAIDKLKTLRNKFPYSHYSADAQLRLADVYFMQESFAEAAGAYESFRDLHPKHEKLSYAMYRIGESYLDDAPSTIARDLTSVKKAEDAFNEFLKRFPADPKTDSARAQLLRSRSLLAQKELYIANFYNRDDQYDSALRRYEKLIELYPETDPAKEARLKLATVQKKINKIKEKNRAPK